MKRVVLAGVSLKSDRTRFEYAMEEMRALCDALKLEAVTEVTQQSNSMDPGYAFRKGKLEELKAAVKETEADTVIFYNTISVLTAQRISAFVEVPVIDRTALILDIFSLRARSREAILQTELARLKYDLPKLLEDHSESEEHSRASYNNRGAGEMRSAVIRRKYARRMEDLKEELEKIAVRKDQDERRRNKLLIRRAALVGYTNAGKSSLLNAMIEEGSTKGQPVYTEDMLFATLDTSVRMVNAGSRRYFLYDTVGFVSDLPHDLVEAFRSTLDAARYADLLIHVIDCSDPRREEKAAITDETLKQIGAGDIPQIRVYNKIDLAKEPELFTGNAVSCRFGTGIRELKEKAADLLYPDQIQRKCHVPYDRISVVDSYRNILNVTEEGWDEEGGYYTFSGPKNFVEAFRDYYVKEEEI